MNGLINIYKEQDFTSFDVVAKLRGILHLRKIGHTGTLDPMAEGVLPVCIGSATKLCDMLTDHDKVYEAVMILGQTYDTLDVTGVKLTENNIMSTETEIVSAVKSFTGGYEQVPPMYSAKKVDGQKLYDLARQGKVVERKGVHVDIYDIEITKIDLPRVWFKVHCGKGTYIRSLISDIGEVLKCGAAMESLVRTKVGDFDIKDALTLDAVEQLVRDEAILQHIIPVDSVFNDCRSLQLPKEVDRFVYNGNVLISEDMERIDTALEKSLADHERVRIYDSAGKFMAVYEFYASKMILKPYKMFL